MKINVSAIPEEGTSLRFERDGAWFRERLPETGEDGLVLERVDIVCTVRRMRESVYVEGSIEAAAETPCSRCLETSRLSLRSPFHYTFTPSPAMPEEDLELREGDLDSAYYDGDEIDLDLVLVEQILLQVPQKPLCAESCRGLCPHCGVNLNTKSCGCREEHLDERLAILKQFKVQP